MTIVKPKSCFSPENKKRWKEQATEENISLEEWEDKLKSLKETEDGIKL